MSQGSTIPNARSSTITSLTVHPPTWSSHPRMDKSAIANCTFDSLTSSTVIDHSRLTSSTLSTSSTEPGKSSIDRSALDNAYVTDSHLDRSTIKYATVTLSHLDRSAVTGPDTIVSDSLIDRSNLTNCTVSNRCVIERTAASNCIFSDKSNVSRCQANFSSITKGTKAERSVFQNTNIEASKVERSNFNNCDIVNCRLERTVFKGMKLRNGRWERGNLVGKMGDEEVVAENIEVAQGREMREKQEMGTLQEPLQPERPEQYPRDEKTMQPDAPSSLLINIMHSSDITPTEDEKKEHLVTSPISESGTASSGVGWSTGLEDTDPQMETYDGPKIETPPPAYAD